MSHQLSLVLLQFLKDEALVTVSTAITNWPGFVTHLPPEGDNVAIDAVVVIDTSGVMDGRSHKTGKPMEHPGFQIRVRSRDPQPGWDKIVTIRDAFDSILRRSVTVESSVYSIQAINRSTPIIPLGKDQQTNRFNHTFNGTATLKQLS